MSNTVELSAGWTLWADAALRAPGFPAEMVLQLGSPQLEAFAVSLLDQERTSLAARAALIEACRASADPSAQVALKKLWKQRAPDPIANDATAETARRQYAAAVERTDAMNAELVNVYERARIGAAQGVRAVCLDDRFRQALLWQNPSALRGGIDWLLRQPVEVTDNETRKNERLVASYVQRYCVKNDTIGFFGPVGWARFTNQATTLRQLPGPTLLAARTVFFEYWAIDALAAKLSADPAIRRQLVPRLLPQFRLEGTAVHMPVDRVEQLPVEFARLVGALDGSRSAADLANTLEIAEGEIVEMLDELVESGLIKWELELPPGRPHPDRWLALKLAALEPAELRHRAEASLAALQTARTKVATAHDATTLQRALTELDEVFTRETSVESHRAHGKTYAGRTPLYEDCRRDLEVELGRPFLDRLAPALELVLVSGRWFTFEIAARYRRAFTELYARLAEPTPPSFARFWAEASKLFGSGSIVADVRTELAQRWSAILAGEPHEARVVRSASALAAKVRAAFAAPGPGWPQARYQSPDIMISAAGAEPLERGDYAIVLGEIHIGFNTITEPLFIGQHPDPAALIAQRERDLEPTLVAPVWTKSVTRGDYWSMSERDFDLENGTTVSGRPRSHVIEARELELELRDGNLEVVTRDRRVRFDIIQFVEQHLIAESFSAFSMLPHGDHSPRVQLDQLVVARETWRVQTTEIAWPAHKDAHLRFLGAQRWARALGLPRWVFARTPEEIKPMYVDFASSIYVEMLAKLLRAAASATFSEMLPTLDQLWTVDAEGQHYTSELRIAAIDPEPWRR